MHPTVERLAQFIDASPTPFHCVRSTAEVLDANGFTRIDYADEPSPLPVGHRAYVQEAGSIFAFRVGSAPVVESGFRMLAAHTDSPNFRIKPQPYLSDHGYVRLGLERYGGVIDATWADRDLGIAGQVICRAGTPEGIKRDLVLIRRPLCRIPNLAIHLNRDVNSSGLKLNPQTHMPAVFSLTDEEDSDPLRSLLSEELGCEKRDVLTWDLSLFDLTPPTVSGANGEFFHSARLDNQACCHSGLEALVGSLDGDVPASTAVLALFDHEEIGSTTARGANSRTLDNLLRRVLRDAEPQAAGTYSRALAHSILVSADMAHAVHPAFSDRHDAQHMPKLNQGPVIKQNANKRYSTEGETAAMFMLLCEKVDAPVQWYVHRSDMRCGSTVGPILASRLGVKTVDIGNPMLSMHSIREMCGTRDHPWMVDVLTEFFRT